MIETKSILSIKAFHNDVFTDISYKTREFGRDIAIISLNANVDYLYIGFDKPLNSLYFNHNTLNLTESVLKVEYFNGSWSDVNGLEDYTLGLMKSGYISFNRDQVGQIVNSTDNSNKYWYRLSVSSDIADLEISGINLVFADDYDLSLENPYITMPEFLGSQKSHILIHVACRNEILQSFRNKDYYKLDSNNIKQDINAWDLLDIMEVKQAAIMLALSKIMFNMSDAKDDVWANKAHEYRSKYEQNIQIASLSIDFNDNGVLESNENKIPKSNTFFMSR